MEYLCQLQAEEEGGTRKENARQGEKEEKVLVATFGLWELEVVQPCQSDLWTHTFRGNLRFNRVWVILSSLHFPNENFLPRHSSSRNDCIIAPLFCCCQALQLLSPFTSPQYMFTFQGERLCKKSVAEKGHVQGARATQSTLRSPLGVPSPAGRWLAQQWMTPLISSPLGPWGRLALTFDPCPPLFPTGHAC